MTKTATKERTEEASLFAPAQQEPPRTKAKAVAVKEPKPKTTAVAKAEPAKPPAPANASPDLVLILSTIERIATNPNANADSIKPILDAKERMLDRAAKDRFDEAFARMWPKLPQITKDGRIVIESRDRQSAPGGRTKAQETAFAKWPTIMKIIGPILTEHGFTLTHRYSTAADLRIRVTAVLRGYGHTDDGCYFDLPADSGGSKNNAQAWASSGSYGKRHTAQALLNLQTIDEDDDAKSAGKPVVVGDAMTIEQIDRIIEYAAAVECSEPYLLKHLNDKRPEKHPAAAKVADVPASRFDEVIKALQSYDANKRQREADAKAIKK